jgi:virulence-associated protein VapD
MFAIAFDLTVKDAEAHHPKSATQAYTDIAKAVRKFGFERIQGSVYVGNSDDLADLMFAMEALKAMPWFPPSVRDIRGFKVESWSDFTTFMKTKI